MPKIPTANGGMKSTTDDLNAYYRAARAKLVEALGGKCKQCHETENLEFDHIDGQRTWVARNHNRWTRLAKYRREADEGKLQLLCRSCNARKQ